MKVGFIAGTRPNFMKVAPILQAGETRFERLLIHTGQHSDDLMSDVFFRELSLPTPDAYLGVSGYGEVEQLARTMIALNEVLAQRPVDILVVVGDVTSTLAGALVARKRNIPLVHVEAGLRSRNRTMPEETNRILTDSISDLLLTPSDDADANLLNEGVLPSRIVRVGNVMIDTLRHFEGVASARKKRDALGLQERSFALVTLHRPSNVDSETALRESLLCVEAIAERLPVVWPIHPRTRKRFVEFDLEQLVSRLPNVQLVEPLGYLDMLSLTRSSALVATDSGGLQEETTVLGVPCLTMRDETERPVTVTLGTSRLVGRKRDEVRRAVADVVAGSWPRGEVPPGWDGRAAGRVVDAICGATS